MANNKLRREIEAELAYFNHYGIHYADSGALLQRALNALGGPVAAQRNPFLTPEFAAAAGQAIADRQDKEIEDKLAAAMEGSITTTDEQIEAAVFPSMPVSAQYNPHALNWSHPDWQPPIPPVSQEKIDLVKGLIERGLAAMDEAFDRDMEATLYASNFQADGDSTPHIPTESEWEDLGRK